jgi:pilus assembly protein CpaF
MLGSILPPPDQVKILVVDDRTPDIELVARPLARQGYQIISATSGEEALEEVVSEKPSLVLLDVMMPGMDGYEVCRRIKGNPATLFLPVVLLTGLSHKDNRVEGVQAGADDFLTKPVDESELLPRVKSLVRVKFLHDILEDRNRQLKELVEERTRQLEQATQELEKLLAEKAHFTPDLVPSSHLRPVGPVEQVLQQPTSAASNVDRQALRDFKQRLLSRLSGTLEGRTDLSKTPEMVSMLSERLGLIYESSGLRLPDETRQQLFRAIVDEILGYGPIEPLLADPTVSEVMINGPHLVYAERKGRLTETGTEFDDNEHVLRIIDRIVRPLGRRVDRKSPMVDARLPDGSRVNAIIPPCAIDGPSLTIRKFSQDKLTIEDLISFGSVTPQMAELLQASVRARLNIVVAGGTGSGKTTLLNILSSFIPEGERIVTIEDAAELQLRQKHVVRLETQPADLDGTGEVSIRMLVRNSLRMRPDRIVVGEVRGGEALDMLQAMNTGHDGGLTTVHANTPRDTLARLETLVLMAGMDLPLKVVRAQIASAINVIVQIARLRDGSRKVVNLAEVQGMEGDVIVLTDIFVFRERGMQDGRVAGDLEPTGIRPKFSAKLEMAGFRLSADIFMPGHDPGQHDRRGYTFSVEQERLNSRLGLGPVEPGAAGRR